MGSSLYVPAPAPNILSSFPLEATPIGSVIGGLPGQALRRTASRIVSHSWGTAVAVDSVHWVG